MTAASSRPFLTAVNLLIMTNHCGPAELKMWSLLPMTRASFLRSKGWGTVCRPFRHKHVLSFISISAQQWETQSGNIACRRSLSWARWIQSTPSHPISLIFILIGWTIGVLGFDSLRGLGILLFTTASRTALGPTQPPIQWVPGSLSLGVKRLGCEADHSPPSVPRSKNEWSCTSTPPIRLHDVVLS
jgi:hypothetical protein